MPPQRLWHKDSMSTTDDAKESTIPTGGLLQDSSDFQSHKGTQFPNIIHQPSIDTTTSDTEDTTEHRGNRSRRHRKSTANYHRRQQQTRRLRQTLLQPIQLHHTRTEPATSPHPSSDKRSRNLTQRTLLHGRHTQPYDDPTFGDPILPIDSSCVRIWYQNVNGISATDDMSDAAWIAQFADDHDITIVALSETNLAWNNPKVRRKYKERIKQVWPISNVITAASPEIPETPYQPGGVSLIIQGGWSGHTTENHSDTMGRWASTTLKGREGRKVALIVAYRVCQQNVNPERDQTAYMQQWRTLRSRNNNDPNPRQQCLQDLKTLVRQYHQQDTPVILMWDANEPTTTKSMQEFLVDTNLVDIFEAAYDSDDLPATCRRGSQKIDHVMVSPDLIPYIQRQGIETTGYGIPSDHRALYCDIELARWLRGNAAHIDAPTRRGLQSRDPTATQEYLQAVEEYLQGHKFYDRLHRLQHIPADDPALPELLEKLDSDMTQARLAAEKKVQRRYHSQWSPELHKARCTLQY